MKSPAKPAPLTTATAPSKPYLPQPPFGISEDVFESGARIYTARCASCHGTPDRASQLATTMSPAPAQFWTRTHAMAAKAPGEIFLATENGLPHTGMPAYRRQLSSTQLWQVALLLKNSDQPLPDPVHTLLSPE